MKLTERLMVQDRRSFNDEAIQTAAQYLTAGEVVAFPTETVYGLGADATNEQAVRQIFRAKKRPEDNPLIAHVATKEQLETLVKDIPSFVHQLIDAFSPGPLTYVLKSSDKCARNVTAGLATVAVRIPNHPVALKLLKACDLPIAAPSANVSGRPSPTTANHVFDDLAGRIACVLDGGPTGVGVESTVIDCTKEKPLMLRPGGITKEKIEDVLGFEIETVLKDKTEQPASPGMKYKHYAPNVPLWLIDGAKEKIQSIIQQERKKGKRVGVMARADLLAHLTADQKVSLGQTVKEVALNLYSALRSFHEDEIDIIVCETFPEDDLGHAVMNRLKKAASVYK